MFVVAGRELPGTVSCGVEVAVVAGTGALSACVLVLAAEPQPVASSTNAASAAEPIARARVARGTCWSPFNVSASIRSEAAAYGSPPGAAAAPLATLGAIRRPTRTSSLLLALLAAGCGSTAGTSSATHTGTSTVAAGPSRTATVAVSYRSLFSLAAPVQDPATAPTGGGQFALLGGIDAAGSSTAAIVVAGAGGQLHGASLPEPQHDAQAAALAGKVYVFGGGDVTQYDHILGFDPATTAVTPAGTLPRPASDVAVSGDGSTAYIVGGFDGTNFLDTIIAWQPGTSPRVVGRLPVGLRYAAVAVADAKLLIIGGSTPNGASGAIYRFDPATGAVRQIGRLPQPITHGGAGVLRSTVYLVGGRGDSVDAQTAGVWAIDPSTGTVRPAGTLPQPLSDAGVISLGSSIVVAGGRTSAGARAGVGELVPAA